MSLDLIQSFGVVTRQGGEASGRRRFGVPPGGAFDREARSLANALLGLAEDSPVWELGMANVRFRALDCGMAAVVGAAVAITVDEHGAASQSAFPVRAGAEIHIGPPALGARVYVAFRAGSVGRVRRLSLARLTPASAPLRVVAGPQAHLFDLDRFAGSTMAVGMASDRVGIRLTGALDPHGIELPSEPACVGAIQVTGSGETVVLGPDGPTIGGYPKIGVVIDADRDQLGQLRPGTEVAFEFVTLDEARALRRARLDRIARTIAGLRLVDAR